MGENPIIPTEAVQRRVYFRFLPPALLTRFGIIPSVDLHIARGASSMMILPCWPCNTKH